MGDIVGLVQDLEGVVDAKEAEEDAERMLRGRFGLDDLLKQLRAMKKLGPLREIVAKLPMMGGLAEQVDDGELVKVESLIRSMTPDERKRPELIDKSRATRIARGSGRRSKDVRELVTRFEQMREMMATLGSKGGLLSRMAGMGDLAGAGGVNPALLGGGGGMGMGAALSRRELAQKRSGKRDKRKQARKARKKNRKR
jgi:signal recognition particle subunit SRP54